jgi:hypothetical protein
LTLEDKTCIIITMNLPKTLTFVLIGLSLLALMTGGQFLGLSLASFFPTELLTYPFVSLSGFLGVAFSAFFLWLTLSTLLIRFSAKQLLLLIGTATLFIGATTLSLLSVMQSSFVLAGPSPLIYCLLTALLLSDRHLKILLLGILPIDPRVLIIILLGLNTIHHFSHEAYFQIAANFSGVLYAFLYTPLLKKVSHKLR